MVLTTGSSTTSPAGQEKAARTLDEADCVSRALDSDVRRPRRHQHALVELSTEAAQRILQRREVDDGPFVVDAAARAQADAVVVSMEALTAPPVDGEVGGAEADVATRELEAGLHGCVP